MDAMDAGYGSRRSWRGTAAVSFLLLSLLLGAAVAEDAMRHVDDCYFCKKCHTGKPLGRRLLAHGAQRELDPSDLADQQDIADAYGGQQQSESSGWQAGADPTGYGLRHTGRRTLYKGGKAEQQYIPSDFKFRVMPDQEEIKAKSAKPNCTECYGCTTQIEPLSGVVEMHGQNMTVEVGASQEWLFFADIPGQPGKRAVVKVWCMPIDKVHKTFSWRCSNTGEGAKAVQFLVAQQKVMEECGLMDVTIKVWPMRVNAVIPGIGFHVWWDGLWMEKAEGISLNMLSYKRTKTFVTQGITSMLGEKLNKTRVIRAAIYDLLSSQCDRHAQNVFMNEHGNLKLIDNLQALQFSWYSCAMDSIFLPGTQKHAIIKWGGNVVFKSQGAKARRSTNPMVVLDYRCWVDDQRIGKQYDPTLRQCLTKMSKMTARQVQEEYGFPYNISAAVLQQRAADMINHGFEWALRYGWPRNYAARTLRPTQPCCELAVTQDYNIECGHAWDTTVELPRGEPKNGGEWQRPYKDIGLYEGGTFLDPPQEDDT